MNKGTVYYAVLENGHVIFIEITPELKEYSVFGTSFGYPLYYNYSFGTELGGKEKITI